MPKKLTIEECIKRVSILPQKNKITYYWETFKLVTIPMQMECSKHGMFWQKLYIHFDGHSCPKCTILSIDEVAQMFLTVHGNKFTYDWSTYRGTKYKMKMICPMHGEFWQTPITHYHKKSKGCLLCSYKIKTLSTDEISKRFLNVHGNKFTYDWSTYTNTSTPMKMICSIHGEFWQRPAGHYYGQGCPKCNESTGELLIKRVLNNLSIEYTTQKKFKDCRYKRELPFDFYIPSKNICIEYDGEQHYIAKEIFGGEKSLKQIQKRDMIKTQYCIDNNITLIRVPHYITIAEKEQLISSII